MLIAASELTKYFGIALIPLLFAYSLFRQRRVGSWPWCLLIPISAMIGYEYLSSKMYGHDLLRTAVTFSGVRRLGYHASKGGKVLIGLSYAGGICFARTTVCAHHLVSQTNRNGDPRQWNRGFFHHAALGPTRGGRRWPRGTNGPSPALGNH